MEIIKGWEGSITVNGTLVGAINSWEANVESEEKTQGPFINDGGYVYTYSTTHRIKGKLEGIVPKNKDAGQTVLVSGGLNGSIIPLTLVVTNGYTITIPSGTVSNFSFNADGAETIKVSFDFSSSGVFSVV